MGSGNCRSERVNVRLLPSERQDLTAVAPDKSLSEALREAIKLFVSQQQNRLQA